MIMVWFLIGLMCGGLLGAFIMAIIAVNREFFDE